MRVSNEVKERLSVLGLKFEDFPKGTTVWITGDEELTVRYPDGSERRGIDVLYPEDNDFSILYKFIIGVKRFFKKVFKI